IIDGGRMAAIGTTAELKRVFDDRPIVEVRGADPVAIMRQLDALPLVENTSLFGTAVHAVLRSGVEAAGTVRATLEAGGLAVWSVEPVAPSLEDVFLDVVARADGTGAA